ncbi:MAG TPA: peptide-methionine (S)-S-oxide reductase MsrA [candidate division Zixibacteria bacterium]
MAEKNNTEITTLGCGCFWCLEAVFEQLQGVISVKSGYAGGKIENPTYEQVCSGTTDHTEVVQISFDSTKITSRELLEVFFAIHDPTTLNRQGADVGTQYRSVIFYHTPEQEKVAQEIIKELDAAGTWDKPIVTAVEKFRNFYPAEEYHQGYYRHNSMQPYCQVVISPKLAKLRQKFLTKLKSVQQ